MENQEKAPVMDAKTQQEATQKFDDLVQKLVNVMKISHGANEDHLWNNASDFLGDLMMNEALVLELVAYGKIAD